METEKIGLKLNIQKRKIMASDSITSCQIKGETMETMREFIFLDSKITADGDCSHAIKTCLLKKQTNKQTKTCLLLGRKTMPNLDSLLKSKDITLPTKVHLVKLWLFHWSCMDVRGGL